MFKVGDRVRILPGNSWVGHKDGDIVEVLESWEGVDDNYVRVTPNGLSRRQSRFELVETVEAIPSLANTPDSSKPYPNPELEVEQQRQRNLIEYKQKMRDFLYGTTNGVSDD